MPVLEARSSCVGVNLELAQDGVPADKIGATDFPGCAGAVTHLAEIAEVEFDPDFVPGGELTSSRREMSSSS